MLRAFQSYALVIAHHPDGRDEIHYPKLRPVQQQIWNIMQLSLSSTPTLNSG
jgi:hypothetical protein